MPLERLPLHDTLAALPPEWPDDPLPDIRAALKASGRKLVVLDDDPTGAQTVYGVPVLTEWSVDILSAELKNDLSNFYILTNSRSMSLSEAQLLNAEIGRNLVRASELTGRDFVVVGRGDSTLRGHFPGEVDALVGVLGTGFDAWVLVPFFLEGGRYTIDNVHYVAEGEWLTPAGETEFANDSSFGYKSSDLRQWVEEKTAGRVSATDVVSISIDDLRTGGPSAVTAKVSGFSGGLVCVVNAASMRDLEVLNLGLLEAEKQGKRFIYRTAASFIRARLGQSARPLLTREEMVSDASGGGLIIVGSYVQRTTDQLEYLLDNTNVTGVEVHVRRLLSDADKAEEVSRVSRLADRVLSQGEDVVVYTSRRLVTGSDPEDNLSIIRRVSDCLVGIAQNISHRPRFLIAKGGNTSSDLATKGLNVKRSMVPGQIFPGVPVWELGSESRFPGLKYVVFPGNVGGPDALAQIVNKLNAGD